MVSNPQPAKRARDEDDTEVPNPLQASKIINRLSDDDVRNVLQKLISYSEETRRAVKAQMEKIQAKPADVRHFASEACMACHHLDGVKANDQAKRMDEVSEKLQQVMLQAEPLHPKNRMLALTAVMKACDGHLAGDVRNAVMGSEGIHTEIIEKLGGAWAAMDLEEKMGFDFQPLLTIHKSMKKKGNKEIGDFIVLCQQDLKCDDADDE